jgi:multidrug efflux pump subunit AcrB
MKLPIISETIILIIIFTVLALLFDVHGKGTTYSFIITHGIALIIALFLSKLIYTVIHK